MLIQGRKIGISLVMPHNSTWRAHVQDRLSTSERCCVIFSPKPLLLQLLPVSILNTLVSSPMTTLQVGGCTSPSSKESENTSKNVYRGKKKKKCLQQEMKIRNTLLNRTEILKCSQMTPHKIWSIQTNLPCNCLSQAQ